MAAQLADGRVLIVLLANLGLAIRLGRESRRLVRPWLVALVLALMYKPPHPVPHAYLEHPLRLVLAVNLALLVHLVLEVRRPVGWVSVGALAAILGMILTPWPRFARLDANVTAIETLRRGVVPVDVPPGAVARFPPVWRDASYSWDDYRAVLTYLRRHTGPETRVANVLKNPPFPPVNGPVGRISPFPAEAGMPFLWQVGPRMERRFARALKETPDTVVVWVPGETSFDPSFRTPNIDRTIRRLYRPEARFGAIEVWRRMRD